MTFEREYLSRHRGAPLAVSRGRAVQRFRWRPLPRRAVLLQPRLAARARRADPSTGATGDLR